MNLLQFRKMFVELSGRFDLVNEDYSDSGLQVFIDEGSKFLDRLDETQKSWATALTDLALSESYVTFPNCRAIKEVWAASATTGRWQLEKKDLQDLMEGYLRTLPVEMDTGVPLYYSPCMTRIVPKADTAASFESLMGYAPVAGNEYNAILVNVPTSEAITLIINGLFYSPALVADIDSNKWSDSHPLLLYMSTMRQIEVINRSTQGVNDWMNSILVEMKQLGMDLVEEIIAEVSQMEG